MTKKIPPKIAIVIPVYNVERYLLECLNSFENQTWKNFSVFAVNDGSTDKSRDILESYAETHPWLKVIHKNNGGLSSARNAGLNCIPDTYKYVSFVDSDDYVAPNYIEAFTSALEKEQVEYANCGFQSFTKEGPEPNTRLPSYEVMDHQLIVRRYFCRSNPSNTGESYMIGSRMFSRKLIENHRFDEHLPTAEDLNFISRLLPKIHKGVQLKDALYFYRLRKGGLSKRTNAIARDSYHSLIRFDSSSYPEDVQKAISEELWKFFFQNLRDLLSKEDGKENFKIAINDSKKIPLEPQNQKQKFRFHLLKFGFWINKLFYSISSKNLRRRDKSVRNDFFE